METIEKEDADNFNVYNVLTSGCHSVHTFELAVRGWSAQLDLCRETDLLSYFERTLNKFVGIFMVNLSIAIMFAVI